MIPNPSGFPITPAIFEVTDGILIIVLGIMLLFALVHLGSIWNECRTRFPGRWGAFRCLRGLYYERKPAVAISVIIAALWLRFTNLWHLRHITNHHLPMDWAARYSFVIFVCAHIALIWGVVCWIRNISPVRVMNWEWLLILGGAILLSLYWAGFYVL